MRRELSETDREDRESARGVSFFRFPRAGRRRGNRFRPGETLARVGGILLSLALIAFAVYQAARHLTTGLDVLRTQEITDDSYVGLDLYLFRDEQVLYAPGGNVFLYHVQDGEKVPVGQQLASAYVSFDGEGIASLQRQLNGLGRRIFLLGKGQGGTTVSQAQQAASAADLDYAGVLSAAQTGDLAAMSAYAQELLDKLNRYGLSGSAGHADTAAGLTAVRQALVAPLPFAGRVASERAGWFYYTADGYESLFTPTRAASMTPEEFNAMIAASASDPGTGAVGKLILSSTWYAAAYVPLAEVSCFGVGRVYDMLINDSAETVIPMTCMRLVPDAGGALLVFSAQSMPAGFTFSRRISAETVYSSVSGYRIPSGAVVTQKGPVTGEDVNGVYVLEGNRVVFRRIDILARRDGYLIARTSERVQSLLSGMSGEDADRVRADGWEFLTINDNVILGGSDLYEGKMVG